MAIANFSTTIPAAKTAGEVQQILAKAKVSSTSTHYDESGEPAGVSFALQTPRGRRDFQLPVNVDGVQVLLFKDPTVPKRLKTREQASRVAWRIARDWVRAQLALIESGMASIDQIMLPYLVDGNGVTLYQRFTETQGAIEA